MNHTYDTMSEPHFAKEQIEAAQQIKVLLMFHDGANRKYPDEEDHNKTIAFVFNNMQHRTLVQTLIERGITSHKELMARVAEGKDQHSSLHHGLL